MIANAAPQMAYIQYWTKLQSHMAWATAKIPALRVPGSPIATGVAIKWKIGSPMAQNRRPVPIPEQMDMAHQDAMLYSGFASLPPITTSPYRPIRNTTARIMNVREIRFM